MSQVAQEFQVKIEVEASALETLEKLTELSRGALKNAAQLGAVWLQSKGKPQRLRRLKKQLKPGQQLYFYYNPEILSQTIVPALCLADEKDYSVWIKPRGMASQGSKWGDANSIGRHVEQKLQRPTFVVHRLDKMTAGLIILSHRKSLVQEFTTKFINNDIQKIYWAVVEGIIETEQCAIEHTLDDKKALSLVRLLATDSERNLSLVEVQIQTGRKHQIRRHMAAIEHPVLGDRLYGSENTDVDLQLVAQKLRFGCPVTDSGKVYQLPEQLGYELLDSSLLKAASKSDNLSG